MERPEVLPLQMEQLRQIAAARVEGYQQGLAGEGGWESIAFRECLEPLKVVVETLDALLGRDGGSVEALLEKYDVRKHKDRVWERIATVPKMPEINL